MINLDGIFQWVKLIFSRMETSNENDFRFVYMVQNIHETTMRMKATLKHYEELASRDPLTQIFNHGRIETEICNAMEQSHKAGMPIGLMILDIDHFKSVNDRFGHAVGDTTLKHFAEIINEKLSGTNAAVGRWGGEEFAAVLYGTDEEHLKQTAEMLRIAIAEGSFEGVGSITCSVGATMLRREDVLESWFERADQALYNAKTDGRNRICLN
jgi:diguanylate cyclase (GGDEF)-like protein